MTLKTTPSTGTPAEAIRRSASLPDLNRSPAARPEPASRPAASAKNGPLAGLPTTIEALPAETMHQIFDHLDSADVGRMGSLNQRFKGLAGQALQHREPAEQAAQVRSPKDVKDVIDSLVNGALDHPHIVRNALLKQAANLPREERPAALSLILDRWEGDFRQSGALREQAWRVLQMELPLASPLHQTLPGRQPLPEESAAASRLDELHPDSIHDYLSAGFRTLAMKLSAAENGSPEDHDCKLRLTIALTRLGQEREEAIEDREVESMAETKAAYRAALLGTAQGLIDNASPANGDSGAHLLQDSFAGLQPDEKALLLAGLVQKVNQAAPERREVALTILLDLVGQMPQDEQALHARQIDAAAAKTPGGPALLAQLRSGSAP